MMFIAHMPAGFLLTRRYLQSLRQHPRYVAYLMIGLFASVAPDLDMFYFHLIDNRQHPHHSYWTHIPIVWLGIYALLVYPIYLRYKHEGVKILSLFLLGGLLHMSLDSVASGIKWLYPFNQDYHGIWRIPSVYKWWVANYLFHWTFLLELMICAIAGFVFMRDRPLQQQIKIWVPGWFAQGYLYAGRLAMLSLRRKSLTQTNDETGD